MSERKKKETDAQRKALDLTSGKVVVAGAGSGKTWVLTERYIRLMEEKGAGPDEIIAVTFTRKAANELLERVNLELRRREREQPEKAVFWREQREKMPWARIGTMHNLYIRILKTFPLEAGIDPEFSVLGSDDPAMEEEIRAFVGRLAMQRGEEGERDLRVLLDRFGNRDKIVEILRLVLYDFDLREACRKGAENPENVKRFFSETIEELHGLLQKHGVNVDLPQEPDYGPFLEGIESLARVVKLFEAGHHQPKTQLTYDDLEQLTLKLLRERPDVIAEIQRSFRYLLVDEFQDTSTAQWEIISLLVSSETTARGGNGREINRDKLFIVGDTKQSIYGFRDANVTVLTVAREAMETETVPDKGVLVNMDDCFRSVPTLVKSLNAAFQNLFTPLNSEHFRFESQHQELKSKRTEVGENCIHGVEFAYGPDLEMEEVCVYLAERLIGEVGKSRIIDLEKNERPLEWNDIAVLLPKRRKLDLITDVFRAYDIPFQADRGGRLFESREIRDLMLLIAALADYRDRIAWAGLLRSPFFSLSDNALAMLFLSGENIEIAWQRALEGELPEKDRESLRSGYRLLMELREASKTMSHVELLNFAMKRSGSWAAYSLGVDPEMRLENMDNFLEIVRKAKREGYTSLWKLNSHLNDLAAEERKKHGSETRELLGEGLKILTIHGSKGLQFPYVILTDLDTKMMKNKSQGTLLVPENELAPLVRSELQPLAARADEKAPGIIHSFLQDHLAPLEFAAERKRLMYVAATRTENKFLIATGIKENKPQENIKFSFLDEWLEALEIEYDSENGILRSEIEGVTVSRISIPETNRFSYRSLGQAPDVSMLEKLPDKPGVSVDELKPAVRLSILAHKVRLVLPITGVAHYLASGSEEDLQRLFWYASEREGSPAATTSITGKGLVVERDEDSADVHAGNGNISAGVGLLVHEIYQRFGPGCDWSAGEKIASEWLESQELDDSERELVERKIMSLLQGGKALELGNFASGSLREVPVQLRMGEGILLRGSVDLVVPRGGGSFLVIDYKTDDLPSGKSRERAFELGYDHQVRLYCLAIARAWRTDVEKVGARLAFLAPREMVEVAQIPDGFAKYSSELELIHEKWRSLNAHGGLFPQFSGA